MDYAKTDPTDPRGLFLGSLFQVLSSESSTERIACRIERIALTFWCVYEYSLDPDVSNIALRK